MNNLPLLIDTHCHPVCDGEDATRYQAAREVNVHPIVVGCDAKYNAFAQASGEWFTQGFAWSQNVPEDFEPHPDVVAIGELGFDLHYEQGPTVEAHQREVFERQALIARRRHLPIIVHTREADALTYEMLSAAALPATGVIHSYTGDKTFARQLLDLGYFISLSGIVTFRNADALREVAKYIPDDRLLVETDTPYLAPVPLRGQQNQPQYVRHTASLIAQLRGLPDEAFAQLTTANAYACFPQLRHTKHPER